MPYGLLASREYATWSVLVGQGELVGAAIRGLRQGRPRQLPSCYRPVLPRNAVSLPQPDQQTQTHHCNRQLGLHLLPNTRTFV